jgi:hypothetical protein
MAFLYDPGVDTSRVYYGTDTRLSGLLLGSFLAMVWTPWRSRAKAAPQAGPMLDLVGVAGLVIIAWFMLRVNAFDPFIYRGGFLLLDVVCITVIAVLVHPAARLSRVLAWSPLVWVGLRSYSLYLWHWPIFMVTRPELDVPLSGFPLFVFRMALTFGAAELSFRYVETPLRKGALGRWYRDLRTSAGPRRQALARRGLAVGATFSILLVLIGTGLYRSTNDPDREAIELAAMGEATAELTGTASVPQDDDPSAPVSTAPSTTTTPTTAPTTTVAGAPSTAAPATTTTAAPANQTDALAVGDSVMLGAQSALVSAMPGIRVDAKVGRQFTSVSDVVGWYASEGLIPGTLVVHAGTNGTFTDADLDRMMDRAGDRKVLLVNAKVARPWQELVNQRLAAAAQRHSNAVLVDWYSLASAHPEWFAADGAHLRPDGARAFAELIRSNL